MARLKRLTFLLSIYILLQYADGKREKRGVTDFLIPGINVGDIAIDQFKNLIFGKPADKAQMILDRQVEHMETTREILALTHQISGALENTPEITVMIQSLQKLPSHLDSIDESFTEYEVLESSGKNASDFQVLQFAKNSINRYIGPLKEMIKIYSLVVPRSRGRTSKSDFTLLPLISRHMKGYKKLCDLSKSQQQIGQSYLASITVAEIKTFMIMEYSMRKLAEVHSLNYEDEKRKLKNGLRKRLQQLTSAFQPIMKGMSREVWRCDPEKHIEDETYFKMTVFQMYVARDKDLRGTTTCWYNCNYFKNSYHYRCSNMDDYYDSEVGYTERTVCESVRMCAGDVYNCYDKFEEVELWSCPAPKNSSRRYEYFLHGVINPTLNIRELERFGKQGKCKTKYTYDRRNVESKTCEMCLCTCDDSPSPDADSKINLRPVMADEDYVITGLRWVKKAHTLHIQIEQGLIGKRGEIDPDSLEWKDIEEPRNEKDIALISFKGLKNFLLQDVQLEEGRVMTGIKLEIVENNSGKFVTFGIQGKRYKWTTGKLLFSYSTWEGRVKLPSSFSNSEQADLRPYKVQLEGTQPSQPTDSSKKYVELDTSEFRSDAGQNTIPFFEMQDNIQYPAFPLSGVGIYFKENDDHAGFLALKLLSYDSSPYIVEKIES